MGICHMVGSVVSILNKQEHWERLCCIKDSYSARKDQYISEEGNTRLLP